MLKNWEYCLRDSLSVCFTAKRSHLLHQHSNPSSTAFPCTFTGLSSALYSTCQDRELNMSILLHLAKRYREKSSRGVLLYLYFYFFLCTVITRLSGLHIHKSFIGVLMDCTWRKSVHFGCNYSGMRYCVVSHGKSPLVFLLDCTQYMFFEVLVYRIFLQKKGTKKCLISLKLRGNPVS